MPTRNTWYSCRDSVPTDPNCPPFVSCVCGHAPNTLRYVLTYHCADEHRSTAPPQALVCTHHYSHPVGTFRQAEYDSTAEWTRDGVLGVSWSRDLLTPSDEIGIDTQIFVCFTDLSSGAWLCTPVGMMGKTAAAGAVALQLWPSSEGVAVCIRAVDSTGAITASRVCMATPTAAVAVDGAVQLKLGTDDRRALAVVDWPAIPLDRLECA